MSRSAWVAFVAVSILWGVPYLFIKVAVGEVSPAFVAWSRVLVAAVLVVPIAWHQGAFAGMRSRLHAVVAFAGLEIAIPFSLIPFGETFVSSSLTAILISTMPLVVAILALRFAPGERPTAVRVVGLGVGPTGVAALMGIDVAGRPNELIGAGCVIAATICYASSPIIVNRHLADLNPMGPVAAGLAVSAVALTPFAILTHPAAMPSRMTVASLATLGVLCTALALVVYFYLIAEAEPSRASVITYVNPAVAVLLGVVLLGEAVTFVTVAELLLIIAGSWLATDGRLPPGLAVQLSRFAVRVLRLRNRLRHAGSSARAGDCAHDRTGRAPDLLL